MPAAKTYHRALKQYVRNAGTGLIGQARRDRWTPQLDALAQLVIADDALEHTWTTDTPRTGEPEPAAAASAGPRSAAPPPRP